MAATTKATTFSQAALHPLVFVIMGGFAVLFLHVWVGVWV
jgi:hypothetical protein